MQQWSMSLFSIHFVNLLSAMPQRQDSFPDGAYHNMNMQSSPAGPLGLVQPPSPMTPPALAGATGLGVGELFTASSSCYWSLLLLSLRGQFSSFIHQFIVGMGSGGRLYSTAPGAEGTFRNNNLPPAHHSNNIASNTMFGNRQSKDSMNMGRSSLLEDFRNNRIPNLQLKDLSHHVVEFSQDQHGSR